MKAHLVSQSDLAADHSSLLLLVHSEGSSKAPWNLVAQNTPSCFCCSTGESQHKLAFELSIVLLCRT